MEFRGKRKKSYFVSQCNLLFIFFLELLLIYLCLRFFLINIISSKIFKIKLIESLK